MTGSASAAARVRDVALSRTCVLALLGALTSTAVRAEPLEDRKLLFLGNKNIAPIVYLEGDIPSGVVVDLVRAAARHLPAAVEIRAMDWTAAQDLVLRGEADALIQINPSDERRKLYDFSEPLLESQFSIFVRSSTVGISGAKGLRHLRVGVEAGGLPQHVLSSDPEIQLIVIGDFVDGFRRLTAHDIDAVVVDFRVGSYVIAKNRIQDVTVTGEPVAFSHSAIAVRKGNKELLDAVNGALRAIRADGSYDRVLERWKPKEGVFWTREELSHLAVGALVTILLIAGVWTLFLVRELRRRKGAEERLTKQNAVLGGIINGADALIFSTSREYRYTSFNSGHARVMKALYGVEVSIGQSLLEAMTVAADREEARRNLDRALAGEHVIEEAYSGGEGRERRYFRVAHNPVRGAGGDIIGVVVVAQDLTDRKHSEETIRRINRELRAFTVCSKAMMRAADEPSLLHEVCRVICEEAGYRMAWVGYPCDDEAKTARPVAWSGVEDGYLSTAGISWAETERGQGPFGTAIRTGKSASVQDFTSDPAGAPWREAALARGYRSSIALPLKDRSGGTFGVLAIYSQEPNAFTADEGRLLEELAGELAFGISVLRARTELQKAQDALARSEDQYRRIVETAREGIWVGDAEYRTTFVNRRLAEMLGYSVDEMRGAPAAVFTDDEGRRAIERQREDAVGDKARQSEVRLRRKDGAAVWALVESAPFLDEKGCFAGTLAMVTDVSERRSIEAQFRQAQKLEAVGRLAGGVAHDFNNLLTAILGNAQLISDELEPGHPLRTEAMEIQATAQKAALLTRQLLAFGRKQPMEPRVVEVGEIVAAMDRMLRRLIGEDIELTMTAEPGLGRIRVDPVQLEQVLLNLAVNARDAMPSGGSLVIEATNVEVNGEGAPRLDAGPGRYVRVTVRDTGVGMTADVQAHLFEPFFTTKGPGKGTGLGLATVYGIVKQAGGDILVNSQPGTGSAFEVYLPRIETLPEAPVLAVPRDAPRGTETVLVVEDEPMVRALAVRVLRGAGYTVIDATDPEHALRLASDAEVSIQLLLSDVVMPRVSGPELADRIRARRPALPVLFASGYMDRVVDVHNRLDSRTAFIAKPFTAGELARRVRELLDRRGAGASALVR